MRKEGYFNLALIIMYTLCIFLYLISCAKPVIAVSKKIEKAALAGGCFWCMEEAFEKVNEKIKKEAILSVTSGFMGGSIKNPSYKDVARGKTRHVEMILISYDSKKITFEDILEIYWQNIDPTDSGGQFVDRGPHYRPVIFYYNKMQKNIAKLSKLKLIKKKVFKARITTEILPATPFYEAEQYHQDYHKKNPWRYNYYKKASGRPQFLQKHWPKELNKKLK